MEDFHILENDDLPPEALEAIRRAQEEATREISDFTISFVSQQCTLGSGTLVTSQGCHGVLTAFHVAEALMRRNETFGMIISDQIHQFMWRMDWVDIIPVGKPDDPTRQDLGPDLAFFRLLEPQRLGTLRSKKSFYRLDGRSFDQWRDYPFERMPWWIAGSPEEFATSEGERNTARHILSASHFHAEATFLSFEGRGEFDYVNLEVIAGAHSFPADYGGMSGGGVWLTPLALAPNADPATIQKMPPLLFGTVFYQSAEFDQKRCISGHGPKSVYMVVPRTLAQRGFVRQQ